MGRQPDRLQHPRRAHGLAAVGAAAEDQSAGGRPCGKAEGRRRGEGLRRQAAEVRRAALSCEDPDDPENWPRNLFVWRSNLLGSSGKGHEYFLKHLLGTTTACRARIWAPRAGVKPGGVWHDEAPEGKLDLLVTLDFRMSTTCVYSDIVLPTATWYEKNDLNTSDMHPFIHPLQAAVDPAWESKQDWEIFKGIAKKFSEVAPEVLGVEKDVVLLPIQHDSPARSPSRST
jgi:nitrate reductase alpha subunit